MTPEQRARVSIDALLVAAGWHVCGMADANIHAARGVALREFPLNTGHGFADYLPLALTEHGAIMAASVLNSDLAVEISVYVVRGFVQLRAVLLDHKALADKLAALERRASNHDNSLAEVIDAIRALMAQPKPANRPIRFTAEVTGTPAKRYLFDSCLRTFHNG